MVLLWRLLAVVAVLAWLAAGPAAAADRTIIILDGSGSMWGQIGGKPKLEIAREALRTVLAELPADREVGFMAYGHREKGRCDDIELIVPPAAGTAAAISKAADGMKFLGKTPLSAAVRQAAQDMRFTEDKATVVLITDGLETCEADPCALANELEQQGVDFTAHVVGFGLSAEEGKQVSCLADNTGGRYIQADDAGQLKEALAETVVAAPEPAPAPAPAPEPAPAPAPLEYNLIPKAVLKEGVDVPAGIDVYFEIFRDDDAGIKGDHVDSGYQPAKLRAEPGDYILVASSGDAKAQQKITLTADKAAEPVLALDAAALFLRARPAPDTDIDGNAQIIINYPGGQSSANFGQAKLIVPTGETTVTVKLGSAEIVETMQLAAGQIVDKDIVVGVGKARADAFYTQGGEKVGSSDLSWKVYKAAKKIDGTREQVSYGFGPGSLFDLPPGDYVMGVEMQAAKAEQPFNITVGQMSEVAVTLNAGVVAIEAPGADGFRIYEAKKNLAGERNQAAYGFGETFQTTLAAGDYVVVTNYKIDKADSETAFTVKAGERTEVAVP